MGGYNGFGRVLAREAGARAVAARVENEGGDFVAAVLVLCGRLGRRESGCHGGLFGSGHLPSRVVD